MVAMAPMAAVLLPMTSMAVTPPHGHYGSYNPIDTGVALADIGSMAAVSPPVAAMVLMVAMSTCYLGIYASVAR